VPSIAYFLFLGALEQNKFISSLIEDKTSQKLVWKLDKQVEETLKNLLANNFEAKFAETAQAAKDMILRAVSKDAVVGIGDSATIRQVGILEELEHKGNRVLNPFSRELTTDSSMTKVRDDISRKIFSCDVFVVGTNAVTVDGKLVNIDAVGNRVAAMIFGPGKVFVVVGRNKIVKDVEEAVYRIKNVIAPFHAGVKEFATPCAQTGKCVDCDSAKRICSVTTIMEKMPWRTDMTVIIVDEDLGLGWDEAWPMERINRIKSNYERVTWVFASARTP
jgi:L-lactate utilization protein LutB